MKTLEIMNANKSVLLLFIIHSFFSFSQKKEDAFFILKDGDSEYAISNLMFGKEIGFINLLDRDEYEYHQKKVKEAKKEGNYYSDPESGRDNLKIKVSKLTFKIKSRKEIKITECEIEKLNLVDYNWIINNSWKKIAKQSYNFKDIYFLHQNDKDIYVLYKVGVTIVAH